MSNFLKLKNWVWKRFCCIRFLFLLENPCYFIILWSSWFLGHESWFVTGPRWFTIFNQLCQSLPNQSQLLVHLIHHLQQISVDKLINKTEQHVPPRNHIKPAAIRRGAQRLQLLNSQLMYSTRYFLVIFSQNITCFFIEVYV